MSFIQHRANDRVKYLLSSSSVPMFTTNHASPLCGAPCWPQTSLQLGVRAEVTFWVTRTSCWFWHIASQPPWPTRKRMSCDTWQTICSRTFCILIPTCAIKANIEKWISRSLYVMVNRGAKGWSNEESRDARPHTRLPWGSGVSAGEGGQYSGSPSSRSHPSPLLRSAHRWRTQERPAWSSLPESRKSREQAISNKPFLGPNSKILSFNYD